MIKTKHPITNHEIIISQNMDGFYVISMRVGSTMQYMSEDFKWIKSAVPYSSIKTAQSFLDIYLKNLKHPIKESAIDRILEAI